MSLSSLYCPMNEITNRVCRRELATKKWDTPNEYLMLFHFPNGPRIKQFASQFTLSLQWDQFPGARLFVQKYSQSLHLSSRFLPPSSRRIALNSKSMQWPRCRFTILQVRRILLPASLTILVTAQASLHGRRDALALCPFSFFWDSSGPSNTFYVIIHIMQ